MIDFNRWLREEMKYTSNTAKTYTAGIADFYDDFNVPLSIDWAMQIVGYRRPENTSVMLNANQVEKLAYFAPTLRDKAIMWCMFQGCMDMGTCLSLNWSHVMKEIDDPPMGAIMLRELRRIKQKGKPIEFDTFIYKAAIKHLRMYLEERCGKNYHSKLDYDDPLFVSKYDERLDTDNFRTVMREVAYASGMERERFERADINPLRPHALRASGQNELSHAHANQQFVDYLSGHRIPYDSAYYRGGERNRVEYVEFAEQVLEPKPMVAEGTEELRQDIEALQRLNADLTIKFDKVSTENMELIERLNKAEERLGKAEGNIEGIKSFTFNLIQEAIPLADDEVSEAYEESIPLDIKLALKRFNGVYEKDEIEEFIESNK